MSASEPSSEIGRTLGLILAGGRSQRMGGGDKALLRLGGAPLLSHAVNRLRPQCGALALNANGDPKRFFGFGLPVVADDPPDYAGPLAGVLAGLEFARRELPEIVDVVSLPADTPFAPSDLVQRLYEARRAAGAAIAVAASGGRTHHAVALWPVTLAEDLRHAVTKQGMRKVEHFAERYGAARATWAEGAHDPFFNVNRAEDLAEAAARLAALRSGG